MHRIPESETSISSQLKMPNLTTISNSIPIEVLLTAGKISVVLYDNENSNDKSIVPFKHKRNKPLLKDVSIW